MIQNSHPYRSIQDMKMFLEFGALADPIVGWNDDRSGFIEEVLSGVDYEHLQREEKGIVRSYLQVATGYSRAQVARTIATHRNKALVATVQSGVKMALPKSVIPVGIAACLLLLMTSASFRSPEAALVFLNGDSINVWDMSKKFADTLPMDRSLLASISTVNTVMPDGTRGDLFVAQTELWPEGYHKLTEQHFVAETAKELEDKVADRRETRLQKLWASLLGKDLESSVAQRRQERLVTQSSNNQIHAAADPNVVTNTITVSGGPTNIWALLGSGREGEVLMMKDGLPGWGMPASIVGNPELGAGRVPVDLRRGGGGSGGRSYGGDGGASSTTTTTNTTTTVTNTVGDSDWTISGTDIYSGVSGNVGIGTTAPSTKLEVVGTASGTRFHASDLLTTSGGLIVEEGQTITLNSVAYLFPASDGVSSGRVLKTDSNGNLSWATDDNDAGIGISQVAGDARYVQISGDTMTGSLEVSATASGWTLHAQDLLTSSGALSVDGLTYLNSNTAIAGVLAVTSNISGSGVLSIEGASSLQGAVVLGSTLGINGVTYTFPASDGAASGWVLKTDASGTLSWAVDSNDGGLSQAVADNRYVNTSGDTMTGALNVQATMSGDALHVMAGADSYILGNVGIGTTSPEEMFEVAGNQVISGNNGFLEIKDNDSDTNKVMMWNVNGETRFDYYGGDLYFRDGGTVKAILQDNTGNFGIGNINPSTLLDVTGAMSGHSLHVRDELTSSGMLIVEEGQAVRFNGVSYTFPASDGAASGWVLKTDSSGTLSWAEDSNDGGLSQAVADDRYVNIAGDTMTGALNVQATMSGDALHVMAGADSYILGNVGIGTSDPETSLDVVGTISGSALHIADTIGIGIAVPNNLLHVYSPVGGSSYGRFEVGDSLGSQISFKNTDREWRIGIDSAENFSIRDVTGGNLDVFEIRDGAGLNSLVIDSNSFVGIGTATPSTKLEVAGTASGDILHAQKELTSSGMLIVEEGQAVRFNGVSYTFPASDGAASGWVLKTDASGTLSWAVDSNDGGLSQAVADDRYVNTSGDTMTGALNIINEGADISLNVSGAMSGTSLYVSGTGATPIFVTDQATGRVGIGTSSPASTLDILSDVADVTDAEILRINTTNNLSVGNDPRFISFYSNDTLVGDIHEQTTEGNVVLNGVGGFAMQRDGVYYLGAGSTQLNIYKPLSGASVDGLELYSGANSRSVVVYAHGTQESNIFRVTDSTKTANYFEVDADGDVGIGTSTPSTKLAVKGTMSGHSLHVRDLLTSSGALSVDGLTYLNSNTAIAGVLAVTSNISGSGTLSIEGASSFQGAVVLGSTLEINGVTYTFPASDGAASGQILATDAAGNLSWITDQTSVGGGGGSTVVQLGDTTIVTTGSVLDFSASDFVVTESPANEANISLNSNGLFARLTDMFVHTSGDTMTGALNIINEGAGPSLNVVGIMSGTSLQVTGTGTVPLFYTDITTGRVGIGNISPDGTLHVTTSPSSATAAAASDDLVVENNTSAGISVLSPDSSISNVTFGSPSDTIGARFQWEYDDNLFTVGTFKNTAEMSLVTGNAVEAVRIDGNGNVGIGNANPSALLDVTGAMSGHSLHVRDELTSSGMLIVEEGQAVRFNGVSYTFPASDGAASGWVLKTDASGILSWAEDSNTVDTNTQSSTGALQTVFDNRYVNIAGDTMTGALNVQATMSGDALHVMAGADSYFLGNVGIGTDNPAENFHVSGAIGGGTIALFETTDALGNLIGIAKSNQRWGFGLDSAGNFVVRDVTGSNAQPLIIQDGSPTNSVNIRNTGYVGIGTATPETILDVVGTISGSALNIMSGANSYLLGNVGIGTTTPSTNLEVIGTISGNILHAQDLLTSSGALSVDGLTYLNSNTAIAGVLAVTSNISGSGTLSIEGVSSLQGAVVLGSTIGINGVTYTFPASDGVSSGWVLKTDAAGTLSWAADSNTADTNTQSSTGALQTVFDNRYVNIAGDTMTGALVLQGSNLTASGITVTSNLAASGSLSVDGLTYLNSNTAITGVLNVSSNISGSGTLSIEGASSLQGALTLGSTLGINGVTYTFPASDGVSSGWVLKTDAAGTLSWAEDTDTNTDTNTQSSTGALQTVFDNRYVNIAGDTMTGALVLQSSNLTASGITVTSNLAASGSLSVDGLVFLNNNTKITGNLDVTSNLSVSGSLSIDGNISQNADNLQFQMGADGATDYYQTFDGTDPQYQTTGMFTFRGGTTSDNQTVMKLRGSSASYYATLGVSHWNTYRAAGTGGDFYIGLDSADGTAWTAAGGNMVFSNNDTSGNYLPRLIIDQAGNIQMPRDSSKLLLGTGQDSSIYYNGTNMVIDPKEVGSGYLEIQGTASGDILHAQKELTSSGMLVIEEGQAIRLNGVSYMFPASDGASSGWVLKTDASGTLSWAEDTDTNTDANTQSSTGALQTVFDNRYVNLSGDTMTGALVLQSANLTASGVLSTGSLSASGALSVDGLVFLNNNTNITGNLDVTSNISGSGTLSIEGASSLLGAVTIGGAFTLPTIDGDSGQVLKTNGEGVLSWQADNTAASGLDQGTADARYVQIAGDTMTGALVIINEGAEPSLEVSGTSSGWILHILDEFTSSGSLSVEGIARFQNATDSTTGFQVLDADGGNSVFNVDTTNERVGIGTASPEHTLDVNGNVFMSGNNAQFYMTDNGNTSNMIKMYNLSGNSFFEYYGGNLFFEDNGGTQTFFIQDSTGNVGIGNTSPTGKLDVTGAMSGHSLHVRDLLTSSGGLIIEEGQAIRLNGVSYTFPASDGVSSGWVLKTDAAGTLSWAADAGGTSYDAGQGLTLVGSDTFALNTTLTGALLDFATVSGATIAAQDLLTSSGALSIDGLVFLNNNTKITGNLDVTSNISASGALMVEGNITSASTISGAALSVMAGADSYIMGNVAIGKTSATYDLDLYRPSGNASIAISSGDFGAGSAFLKMSTTGPTVGDIYTVYNWGEDAWTMGMDGSDSQKFKLSFSSILGSYDKLIIDRSGNMGIGASPTTKLDVKGTMSGHKLQVVNSVSASGALSIEGTAAFGSTIELGGVTYTFPASDGVSSGWVLKTDAAGTLSWAASAGGTSYLAGQGLTLVSGDTFALNSTITGSTLQVTTSLASSGTLSVDGLTFLNSDTVITGNLDVTGNISASGALMVEGNIISASTISGAALSVMAGADSYIMGNVGIGISSPSTALEVLGTMSGLTLNASNDIRIKNMVMLGLPDQTDFNGTVFLGTGGNGDSLVHNSGVHGQENTFVGISSGNFTSTGAYNTGLGYNTLYFNTAGNYNTANGAGALHFNTAGNYNTGNGALALYVNTTGNYNTANGFYSLYLNRTGNYNTANGVSALHANSTGSYLTALGYEAGHYLADGTTPNTTSDYSTYLGYNTKSSDTNAQNEVVIGYNAVGAGDNSVVLGNESILKTLLNGNVGIGTSSPSTELEIVGIASGNILHAQDLLTSSGLLVVETNVVPDIAGTFLDMNVAGTGVLLDSESLTTPGLVIDMHQNNAQASPHLMLGYDGLFDVNLYRGGANILATDDQFKLTAALDFDNESILIDTEETTSTQNVFRIISDVGGNEDNAFRITADGNTYSDNAYSSAGADYAEWFFTGDTDLRPGELVCIDIERENAVKRCENSADSNLIGIVSTDPAFVGNTIGGADGVMDFVMDGVPVPGFTLIGLIGQVPTKVVMEEGMNIRPGDALTASSTPGYARRARPGEPTVGVALERLDGEKGIVKVLISRRNSSLTVDIVEDHVLETVAAMEIEDEVQLMISEAVDNLDAEHLVNLIANYSGSKILTESKLEEVIELEGGSLSVRTVLNVLANLFVGESLSVLGPANFDKLITAAGGISTSHLTVSGSLTAHGSALFLDDVLVEGALVANSINVEQDAMVGGILSASMLEVEDGALIKGGLSIEGELIVNGQSITDAAFKPDAESKIDLGQLIIHDTLFVLGDVTIEGVTTFLGAVDIEGELSVNKNQAGLAMIPKTGTEVTVPFDPPFVNMPVVTASSDSFDPWRIAFRSQTGFVLQVKDPALENIMFTWTALAVKDLKVVAGNMGDGQEMIEFPVDQYGVPLSSNEAWNGCIRGQSLLDSEGKPFSCSRYHDGDSWEHPDLLIEFKWNSEQTPRLVLPEGYRVISETVVEDTEDPPSSAEASEGEDDQEPSVYTGTGSDVNDSGSGAVVTDDDANETGSGDIVDPPTDEDPDTGTGEIIVEEPEEPVEEPEEPVEEPEEPVEEPVEEPEEPEEEIVPDEEVVEYETPVEEEESPQDGEEAIISEEE